MSKAAVISGRGIGDALLMMIAAYQLKQQGYAVTLYHPLLKSMQQWFPEVSIEPFPPLENFSSYDLIIAQRALKQEVEALVPLRSTVRVCTFLSTYGGARDALHPDDIVFDSKKSMASNIATAMQNLLSLKEACKDNGIRPIAGLIHRKYAQRVVIHPTSANHKKNWQKERFFTLARALEERGYSPQFCVGPHQREEWQDARSLLSFESLSDLASFIYESAAVIGNDSALCHLGSNLGLPTIVIAGNPRPMRLWRPDWHPSTLVLPPRWIPNPKWMRLRDTYWGSFISVRSVLNAFI